MHSPLITRPGARRRQTPVRDEILAVKYSQRSVSVADVDY